LFAFNLAVFTILNATALFFPGWIKLGPGGSGGIELMGQAMLTMVGVFLMLGLLLILPVATAAVLTAMVGFASFGAVAMTVVLAAAVLGLETFGLIALLGRTFDRAEPAHVAQ
jgi:hypothetical protein